MSFLKTLLTAVVFVMISTVLAFGQSAVIIHKLAKMDPTRVLQARDRVKNISAVSVPTIRGGAVVLESEPNSDGRKVWIVVREQGDYVVQGVPCNGGDVRALGDYTNGQISDEYPMVAMVHDSDAEGNAEPGADTLCSVQMFRDYGGIIQAVTGYGVAAFQPSPVSSDFSWVGEGVDSTGRYYVLLVGPATEDTTIVVGHSGVATEKKSVGSITTVYFNNSLYLGNVGPTTLTVTQNGICYTITYPRNVVVQGVPPPSVEGSPKG